MNPTMNLSPGSSHHGLARLSLLGALALTALVSTGCPLQTPVNEQALTAITLSGVAPNQNVPLAAAGQTVTFTATPAVADGTAFTGAIEWTSSDPAVVTVASSNHGLSVTLTAVANGQSTITGSGGGVSVQFTVTVTIVQQVASLVVTGPDTLALGEVGTYTVTAKDAGGNTLSSAAAGWSFPGSSDLFQLTGASTGASVEVKAIGVGTGGTVQAALQGFAGVASKTVHATGTSLTVAATPAAGPYLVGAQVTLAATAHGAGIVTGSAARTIWTKSGACTINPLVGAGTTVTASVGGVCAVTATLDTTLTAPTNLTFLAPASVTLLGSPTLEVGSTGTYPAVVKDAAGTVLTGIPVTFSGGGGVFTFTSAAGVATVTGALIGASALTATAGLVSSTALSITVIPASVEWTATTKSMLAGSTAQVFLRARNAAGAAVGFATVPSFGKPSSDLVVTFNPAGPTSATPFLQGDGTLGLSVTQAATGGPFSGSAVLYGKTTTNALALTSTGPDSVTLTTSTDTAPVGSSVALTPSALLGGAAVVGATYTIANAGDLITSPAASPTPLTGQTPEPFNVSISGLGKASLVATVLGVASAAKVVYGVPNALALTQGATVISAATPGTAQLGQAATPVVVTVKNASNQNVAWNQATAAHGTLTLTSSAPGVATVGTCTNPFGSTLSCPLTPVTAGSTTLTATWTSQDGQRTSGGTAALTVTGAAAPVWPTAQPASYDATWTGPKTYDLSFTPATSGDGAITYTIYAATADTTDALLYVPGNAQAATITMTPDGLHQLASITLGTFSSRAVIGVRAKTANSSDSLGQRLTLRTAAAAGFPGAVAFVAGRTVFEVDVATLAVKPLWVLGADSAKGTQPERTAPRWSKTAMAHGYVGVTVNGQGQALYGRDVAATTLAVTPDVVTVQTDGHGCAASTLSRPTVAFDALLNGTLTRMFTTTQSPFVSCGRASLVTTAGGGQQVLLHDLEQVAQMTDSGLVSIDNGWLRAADLSGASVAEMDISSSQLTGVTALAAWPGPGQTSATPHTFVAWSTGLTKFDHTGGLPATATAIYTGDWMAQGARRVERMLAVGEDLLIVETSNNGAKRMLLKVDVSGATAAATVFADDTLTGDDPTLGSSTVAGN